ncbi:MAG: hypothetical protein MJE68_20215, partial [Proteobacteria bacterium]|nr:hypothetical protein [Pseudomonadota bacterium]
EIRLSLEMVMHVLVGGHGNVNPVGCNDAAFKMLPLSLLYLCAWLFILLHSGKISKEKTFKDRSGGREHFAEKIFIEYKLTANGCGMPNIL